MLRSFPVAILSLVTSGALALAAACGSNDAAPLDDTAQDSGAKPSTSSTATTTPTSTSTTPAPTSTTPTSDAAPPVDAGPRTPVRFVAIGDTGKGCSNSADPQCAVADAIKEKCTKDGCDFGVLLGDNIYPSGASKPDDPIFDTVFEQPYKDLTFPFYVALGNHDYGANGAGTDFARGANEIGYTQVSPSQKWKLPANHYHQVFGNGTLEIFVSDTNLAMFGSETAQRNDLKQWMAASTATWKIVTGHHPILSNGEHGNAGNYDCTEIGNTCISFLPPPANGDGVKSFIQDAVCGKADFYFCGHDHSRQWIKDTCNGTELIVSGGGASTTGLPGKNATWVQKDSSGFVYVLVDGNNLTAEFIDATGNVEFSRTVTKP